MNNRYQEESGGKNNHSVFHTVLYLAGLLIMMAMCAPKNNSGEAATATVDTRSNETAIRATEAARDRLVAEAQDRIMATALASHEDSEREARLMQDYSEVGCPTGCFAPKAECQIKGNISVENGAKIYHMPYQKYYAETKIDPRYGERWFCTEQEAINNGWRRSRE